MAAERRAERREREKRADEESEATIAAAATSARRGQEMREVSALGTPPWFALETKKAEERHDTVLKDMTPRWAL